MKYSEDDEVGEFESGSTQASGDVILVSNIAFSTVESLFIPPGWVEACVDLSGTEVAPGWGQQICQ